MRRLLRNGRTHLAWMLTSLASLAASAVLLASPAASAPAARHIVTPRVSLTVGNTASGPPVRAGFVGLATEFWDVQKEIGDRATDPDHPFVQLARNLAPDGSLSFRIGGDSTDWSWWPVPKMTQPPWVRWTITPAWAAATRRLALELHAHLILGINMEANSSTIADWELHEFQTQVGDGIPITYELGNEPELYSHFAFYMRAGQPMLGRPKSYSFADITSQWNELARTLPGVRLAGPGYSGLSAFPYIDQFLSSSPRVSLLTVHTYPLKSGRCNGGVPLRESELFEPRSLGQIADQLAQWTSTAQRFGVAVRVDEMNAVTCGGTVGFSNTFGPALWALNILPLYAQAGVTGVNFQTRPFTAQNLIQEKNTRHGWRVRVQPEYYGLLAFAQLTPPGTEMLQVTSDTRQGLLAWAARTPQQQTHVVLTNVTRHPISVAVTMPGVSGPATVETLAGGRGGLWASAGANLAGQTIAPATGRLTGTPRQVRASESRGSYDVTVAPASATIVSFGMAASAERS